MVQGSKILVTGSSGYIGSSVVKALPADRVLATARRSTTELSADLNVPVHQLDVFDPDSFETSENIGAVIHCATANDILSSDFSSGVNLSVQGTWQTLNLAKRLGASHFVFLSTFQVYGTELEGEISENSPVRCESPYGLNHFMGEEVCRMFSRIRDMQVSILRPANIFGVPAASTVNRATLVPMCFVRDALQGGRLVLKSSGRQQRNFISVEMVAAACAHAVLHPEPEKFRIYNVCSEWEVSIREIAEMTGEIYHEKFGKHLPIEIQSDLPPTPKGFNATSMMSRPRPAADEMRAAMRATIDRLFDTMAS